MSIPKFFKMRFLKLQQWLDWIEHSHPQKIDLSLSRIQQVADAMQLRDFSCPVITVSGTNGKGSTVASLAAIYQEGGYRVGTYTSPHLFSYNERIQIEGEPVSDQVIIDAFAAIDHSRGDISLTYFEFSTLAALCIFQRARLDLVVLEVGLGGRLDAVNIIDANVAIITAVDIDHQAWLGDNREQIGQEKAGILRFGQTVVIADPEPPLSIIEKANALRTTQYSLGQAYQIERHQESWHFSSALQCFQNLPIPELLLENCAAAVMAVLSLQSDLPISEAVIRQALRQLKLTGRFQTISQNPIIIIDVAHNPHATKRLSERLQALACDGKYLAVWSGLADKNLSATVAPLLELINHWHIAPLQCARTASTQQLQQALTQQAHLVETVTAHQTVADAYCAAVAQAQPKDVIIIFGSFYTVNEQAAPSLSKD